MVGLALSAFSAARNNVIYWETSCIDPRFTRRNLKNVFRTEIDGTGFGWYNVEFIAKHLAHRLGKKPNELRVAYLSEDSSYGQSVTETARQRAKQEFGMQEVALEYYTFTTNDLTPVILKLKNANPDILHHVARNQDAILFWRQAREQNFLFKALGVLIAAPMVVLWLRYAAFPNIDNYRLASLQFVRRVDG